MGAGISELYGGIDQGYVWPGRNMQRRWNRHHRRTRRLGDLHCLPKSIKGGSLFPTLSAPSASSTRYAARQEVQPRISLIETTK
jgi:hypothetical protein